MPKANALQTNFTAGEITPRLAVRVDIQKYKNGARTLQNFLVKPHGGAFKRPGTVYVGEVRDSTEAAYLVPFEFNTEQAYMLLFQAERVWVYKDGGIVVASTKTITGAAAANPCVITSAAHGLANGQRIIIDGVVGMTDLNDRYFTVANATTDTFELSGLDASSYDAYSSGGTVYVPVEIETTYTVDEIGDLAFAQSADTLYIAHRTHPLAKLTRSSHVDWELSDLDIETGPFRTINSDDGKRMTFSLAGAWSVASATSANPCVITLTTTHDLEDGQWVFLSGFSGTVDNRFSSLNGSRFRVRNADQGAGTFELADSMGEPYSTTSLFYVGGGVITRSISAFGTIAPGSPINMFCSEDVFETGNVGGLFRIWENGQSARVSSPVTGSTIRVPKSITNAGKVYGLDNLSGGVASASPPEWQSDWLLPTHSRGVVKISDGRGIQAGDAVDCLYLHSLYGVVQITEFVSATEVRAVVVGDAHIPRSATLNGTTFWEEGAWSERRGYPGVLALYEQRLWAAGSTADPQTIWASKTAAYEDFTDGDEDDAALIYQLASGKVDVIEWMRAGRALTVGTASAEYTVSSGDQNAALSPTNLRITAQTSFGSGQAGAIAVGSSLLFAQRHTNADSPSKKVREFIYSFDRDAYVAPDITILAEHITGDGLIEMAYQSSPDALLWAVRADGDLVGLTYEREQEVVAWHRHEIGGEGVVESIAVIPGTEGDELWMIVRRDIDGETKRHVERLSPGMVDDTVLKDEAIYLDSAVVYQGAPTTTISGLWHLEGEVVDVLSEGAHEAGKLVAGGSITLDRSTAYAIIGLPYTSILESLDIEGGAAMGTAQSRIKRVSEAYIYVYRSLGGKAGTTTDNKRAILYRTPEDVMDDSPALKTGWQRIELDGGFDRTVRLYIEHSEPFPMHILGAVAEINTSG